MKFTLRFALLAGVALGSVAIAQSASAQVQAPGFFGSLTGMYIVDSGSDKIISLPSGLGASPDDGLAGKAYLGYGFGAMDIAFGGELGKLSKDKATLGSRTLTVKADYWDVDAELGYTMRWTDTGLRLFAGARYAQFNHDRQFTFPPVAAKDSQEWTGFGPRVGLDFATRLGAGSSFSIFGGAAVSYLFGDIDSKYRPSVGPNINLKNKNADVLNGEAQLGVAWEIAPAFSIAAGYRAEMWDGVAHKNGALNNGPAGKSNVDRLIHGPFVRLAFNIGAPRSVPVMAVAPPPPAPAPMAAKSFIVFFDFDRSNITAQAQATINDAVAAAKAGNSTRITLTGHTDRSGSEQYNQALSVRRGEAVKAAMIRGGIPANAIVVIGRGESAPLVPTADGVREPQNRRVEIVL
jgi:outer membrane protein OmpA-like peptidoglycan-associated protein